MNYLNVFGRIMFHAVIFVFIVLVSVITENFDPINVFGSFGLFELIYCGGTLMERLWDKRKNKKDNN